MGQLMRESRLLTEAQVEQVLSYQSEKGLRFGEAAIALQLASREDVLRALADQFTYPYADARQAGVSRELFMANRPFGEDVEVFRDLRSHLLMTVLAASSERKAVALVSTNIGDGKTFTVANLAVAFSQLPGTTLLVDADLRTGRLHKVFGLQGPRGLSTLLSGRTNIDTIRRVPGLPNLSVLPVGTVPPNPLELLQRNSFGFLMQELVAKFDHVLVDTPAAEHGSDTRLIAARAGAALVLGRRHRTQAKSAQSLVTQLNKAQVAVAGLVMNDF
jgi:chain length determinant protein tyrosine kinase EpsG